MAATLLPKVMVIKFGSTLQLLLALVPGSIPPLHADSVYDGGSKVNA